MRLLVALAAALASAALAAAPPLGGPPLAASATARPDATDARAPQARRAHCSVLREALAPAAPPARDWRRANAETLEAGGWRAYAREAASSPLPIDPCARRQP